MARLHETLETPLPIDKAFEFIANFSNAEKWDPGVAWSRALNEANPAPGVVYQLGVRMGKSVAPMTYRITTLVPNERVVLTGIGTNVSAVDDIAFESVPNGTRITYRADINLHGWLRLVEPFTGSAFAKIARNARRGMQQTLDAMAVPGYTAAEKAA